MRFAAAVGLAALAFGCTSKLEFVDGKANVRPTTAHLAEADEMEAAAAPHTPKPAIRVARSSSFRAQAVGAHDEAKVDIQNSLTIAAAREEPNVVTPAATVVSSGTMQRDDEVPTQAARVDAADRAAGQALDAAQEIALSPPRETTSTPALETTLSPARETALGPDQEAALSPARETSSNEGFVKASACIRNNLKAAYRSSDTVDQATSFLMRTCFAPFSSMIASDEASAKTLFRDLVFQEINPVEWLEARQGGAAQSR